MTCVSFYIFNVCLTDNTYSYVDHPLYLSVVLPSSPAGKNVFLLQMHTQYFITYINVRGNISIRIGGKHAKYLLGDLKCVNKY